MAGVAFCTAGQECEKVCQRSIQFVGIHSPLSPLSPLSLSHYRLIAHIFCVTCVFTAICFVAQKRLISLDLPAAVIVLVCIYITLTWFINLHSDVAEGLQTSYLV